MSSPTHDAFFRIQGGHTISGDVSISGNKNEALPLIAYSLLAGQEVVLENVPDIEDIQSMLAILKELGIKVKLKRIRIPESAQSAQSIQSAQSAQSIQSRDNERLYGLEVSIDPQGLQNQELPMELCTRLRASVCLAVPLLVRFRKVRLPFPGGDRIGRRRLDSHIIALTAMGAKVSLGRQAITISCEELVGADILLDECSVTATENAVAAACFARGKTVIRNAACEPHVQKVCKFLNMIGGNIQGIGSNVLNIVGQEEIGKGKKNHENHCRRDTIGLAGERIDESVKSSSIRFCVSPDYLEVGSFVALGATCGGPLRISPVNWEDMRPIIHVFHRLGVDVEFSEKSLYVRKGQPLTIRNDFADEVPRIDSAPWPGFPADMTSIAVVTATKCRGTVLIHEKMFESRLFFLDALIGMGARIILCDPHRAVIMGPAMLRGTLLTSPDIRAGMALLIAALCAKGESIIRNIVQIDRGFSQVEKRLQLLGAKIERVIPKG